MGKIVQIAAAAFFAASLAFSPAQAAPGESAEAEEQQEEKEHAGRLSMEEFRLGGVSPGVREEDIRNLFGKPIYGDCEIMVFTNGLVAEFDDEHPGVVEELVVAKPGTSIVTAAGVTAGMEEVLIVRRYGRPDEKDENPLHTVYTYYSVDGTLKMKFTAKDGVILKVKCESVD